MIYCYVGTPGSGKSYELTRQGVLALVAGRSLYANYRIVPEYLYYCLRRRFRLSHMDALNACNRVHQLRTFDDLVALHDAVLLFDEAHDWLNSRAWDLIPAEVVSWWSQHRHAGVDVHMATQRYGSVDSHVRSLVGHIYLARPAPDWMVILHRLVKHTRLPFIRYTEMFDEAMGTLTGVKAGMFANIARNRMVTLDPVVARCYDTRGGVFESPLVAMRRARQSEQLISARMRLQHSLVRPGACDGLPFLDFREFIESSLNPASSPSSALSEKFEEQEAGGGLPPSASAAEPVLS